MVSSGKRLRPFVPRSEKEGIGVDRIKGTALTVVVLLVGLALISTGITEYEPGKLFNSVAVCIIGAIMLFAAYVFFRAFALPSWQDRSRTLRDDVSELIRADQTGAEDADRTDALISSFRNSMRGFFASRGLPENSPLQAAATQIYWHILYLQKRRMEKLGVSLDFSAERRSYGGVSVTKESYFDGKYDITDAAERISAKRVYYRDGKAAYTRTDDQLAHYSVLNARRTSEDLIICPNCGNPSSRENLLDGCDYCGTKFTVEDLGARVSSFALREDYEVAYDKYRDARNYYGRRAFLAGAVPVFLLSLIAAVAVSGEIDEGPVMLLAGGVFSAAFCAGAAGFFTMWAFWLWIFPFIQLKKSVTYRSKKNLEQLKRASSWNGQVTEDIRKYDKRFSLEGFFSSLQNKLAAIHYAESEDEIRAFAPASLGGRLAAYADVVDMDVTDLKLFRFEVDETSQRLEMVAVLDLTRAKGAKFTRDKETLHLSLEKSAACRTEAVCAPSVLKCRGCGASISLLEGGRCAYCGTQLNLREHDWVITGYSTV